MADIRTLKLNLLADVSNFNKGLRGASRSSQTFAGRLGKNMRAGIFAMEAAGVAAGALAVKIGVDSVKAAMDDSASQATLRRSLKNTTKATDAQVASTEKWITKMQYATGFSDTDLRKSLARLTNSTHDVTKSQKVLQIAMDVSRGTGKDLTAVTEAIAKALDGNMGALKRLGVPLDDNIIKTKDSKAALEQLVNLYKGQASTYSDTFAGRIAILNERIAELKEGFGGKLIEKLTGILPYIDRVVQVLAGTADSSLSSKVKSLRRGLDGGGQAGADNLATSLANVGKAFGELFDAITGSKGTSANDRLSALGDAFQHVANGINAVANAWKYLNDSAHYDWKLVKWFFSGQTFSKYPTSPPAYGKRAMGGPVSASNSYLVGERGPELFTPNTGGRITSNSAMGGNTTIVLNGIVDAESARRAIERLIQQSQRRTGAVNWAGSIA